LHLEKTATKSAGIVNICNLKCVQGARILWRMCKQRRQRNNYYVCTYVRAYACIYVGVHTSHTDADSHVCVH